MTETAMTPIADLRAERDRLKARLVAIKTEMKGLKPPRKPRGERKRQPRAGSLTAAVVAFLVQNSKSTSDAIIKHFCAAEGSTVKQTSVRTLISALSASGTIQREGSRGSYLYYVEAPAAQA